MLSMKGDENRKHTKLDNKAFILFVLLLSYHVNFTACFFFYFKKILTYTGSELENKRINCEKTGFRAIATRGHDVTKMSRDTGVGHSNRMCGVFTV